jgi:hypothetical protein
MANGWYLLSFTAAPHQLITTSTKADRARPICAALLLWVFLFLPEEMMT